MELIMNDIHMDVAKKETTTQLTVEGDINLAEQMPDLECILLKEEKLQLKEAKCSPDHVLVTGNLCLQLLYGTFEEEEKLAKLTGTIPLEETVYLEGIDSADTVDISYRMEEVSVHIVNSRKISVKGVVTLQLKTDGIQTFRAAVDVQGAGASGLEYRSQQLDVTELAVACKDVCHIHQEISIPGGLPNIYRLIWSDVQLSGVDFRPLTDQLMVTGEMNLFILFENEQEDDNISFYETVVPFSQMVDVADCEEGMIADIIWEMGQKDVEVRPDFDGEQRVLSVDIQALMNIKLYKDNRVSLLSDVYSTKGEILLEEKTGSFQKVLLKNSAKSRMKELIELDRDKHILQLIHSQGEAILEDVMITEDGATLTGVLSISCFYVTSDDQMPYASVTKEFPFYYLLEARGIQKASSVNVRVQMTQLSISMPDQMHLEAAILIEVSGLFLEEIDQSIITDIREEPFDKEVMKALPTLAVYVVQPGDSLWQIGRKYYTSVDQIKRLNGLGEDEIIPGQKLIICKEM